ncbi:Cell wall assembly regulator [Ophidiomyces ophidiicola]|uniref:Cell wall assembly regulator n=1 Tax=Ophidiomyces ophidiicola TaxID=1387563 RepID=A0ACB8UVJ8_9EURO|nr:Cell wall assembly regulator [Ophidiomyces ophidiicola]KAI1912936.1 Cell wall assembly regulator [Ophidiomyces ophidiicola]KAI1915312.1 Cell wall assembly regulator [Ophidiomyces ophidiicola]KAI1926774.1 Cell wall assembly regulator [Ophidiomyces ophidiicola]KAI1945934.1 Cell wall assembly regulator [Ophidiomyces ophidiicola]KAI1952890.1 Cell wall assembly regulator [Ophidiomyces ophidiicola]
MTSNDRHASHDSPYRTGQHVPLSQSRHAPLTSVVTSAIESRPDLTTSFEEDSTKQSQRWSESQDNITSPTQPYSPGMRSKQRSSHDQEEGVQMQSFHDGAPPPPPVSYSWKKIDKWCEHNYEELFDQLCEGCTQNDVNELEHELDCSLPLEVRESLMIHDGQERGGLPTGVLFGCMLLDCEEIVQEWKNWRTVNEEFLSTATIPGPQPPLKAYGGTSASSSAAPQSQLNPLWRQELLDRQDSQPPRAIQKAYAHPSWIPLARDWGGNNVAIDLAPGPAGKWGQVILFGRDYDCKYVIARSWAAFLATAADDFHSGKVIVDEDSNELRLKPFKTADPPYLEILRWRCDQKHGRKPPRKRPGQGGLGVNTAVNGKTTRDSPYGSPTPSEERGRSPHRFPGRGPNGSPKGGIALSSPLARVAEEATSPVKDNESNDANKAKGKDSDLVDLTSPAVSVKAEPSINSDAKKDVDAEHTPTKRTCKADKSKSGVSTPRSSAGLDALELEGMKNIAI